MVYRTWDQERVEEFQALWPDFDLWVVPRYMGVTIWCARPRGERVATINEDSPEAFIVSLALAQAALPDNAGPRSRQG